MRCLEHGMGAAPASVPHQHAPGRLREPPWGYYGPCARSSLTAQRTEKSAGTRKRGPKLRRMRRHSLRAAVERREARVPNRNGTRRASQACRDGFAGRPTGPRRLRRFSALPSPRLSRRVEDGTSPSLRRLGPARSRRAFAPYQAIDFTCFSAPSGNPPICPAARTGR
jgi:hypothetical protein